jgi:hypothetical protein
MCRMQIVTSAKTSRLHALTATWLMEVTMTDRWHLEFHTTLMTLLRLTRNLRSMDCEHCADLLTQAYKCMASETQDIRDRANDGQ